MNRENKLEDVWFISGGTEKFVFTILDYNGEPLYIKNCNIKWTLCDVGSKESPCIVKDSSGGGITLVDDSTCKIEITGEDTMYLESNKYEHELIITQPNGKVLRPCYGYVTVRQGSFYQ